MERMFFHPCFPPSASKANATSPFHSFVHSPDDLFTLLQANPTLQPINITIQCPRNTHLIVLPLAEGGRSGRRVRWSLWWHLHRTRLPLLCTRLPLCPRPTTRTQSLGLGESQHGFGNCPQPQEVDRAADGMQTRNRLQ